LHTGEIIDTHRAITVRIQAKGIGVQVQPGQWWNVQGRVTSRSFINPGGFKMIEDQMEVKAGNATIRKPSGCHIVDYLSRNPRFQGIGIVTAERLWETFGAALFDTLDEGDIGVLAHVIGEQRASMLVQGWQEEGMGSSLQWLQSFGVGPAIGRRILGYFGKDASEKINENPYRLLSFSAGWAEVDTLARKQLGIVVDDERRLIAAIEETVYRRFSLGHTYVPHADLVTGLRSLLVGEGHERSLIDKAIFNAEATGRLIFDDDGNAYSLGASILENQVVDCIMARVGCTSPNCDVAAIIATYEIRKGSGFELNKEQREAVHMIAENNFAVVTGGAGCGKTTVLECVYEVLGEQGYEIAQLALAGKAVKRMMEATGRPAITLASFIHKMKDGETRGEPPSTNRLAMVIDEASMVDLISFTGATRFVSEDTKIILIGDPHQLPPVGPGLILHCLTDIPGIPHVELKVAKRFGSKIAGFANQVKGGVFPTLPEFDQEIRFESIDKSVMAEFAARTYLERPSESVVLCATRSVTRSVNSLVQSALSAGRKPLRLWNLEHEAWEHMGFFEGDLLICMRNHWDMGIQNGSIGRLVEVNDAPDPDSIGAEDNHALGQIEWDDGQTRVLHEDLLDSLELGYAMTVHKSQGSQWARVVVCLPASRMIDRSLVYTALTRAQREIVLVGNHWTICDAVRQRKVADRRMVALKKRIVTRAKWNICCTPRVDASSQ
jgi:exodeoxyribonuclease V alpha subunit